MSKQKNLNLLNFYEVEKWFKLNKLDVVILAAQKLEGFMLIIQNLQISF